MPARHTWKPVLGLLLAVGLLGAPSAIVASTAGPYDEAVNRAIKLLPRRPERVLVVDASRATPPVDARGRRVEAFVAHGDRTVSSSQKETCCSTQSRHRASSTTRLLPPFP
jgi:hypothetical protein